MDFLTSLLNSMPGAAAQGLIWGIMAIGVYLTYRILDVADLTVDGSLGTGGAVCVVLVRERCAGGGCPAVAAIAGRYAGGPCYRPVPHGLRHPRNSGRYPDPAGALFGQPAHHGYRHGRRQGEPAHQRGQVRSAGFGRGMSVRWHSTIRLSCCLSSARSSSACCTGSSAQSLAAHCAQPVPTSTWPVRRASTPMSAIVLGLMISNGLVALAGGLLAQYQGFSDINMGRGAIVIGLAAVIIGEVVFGKIFRNFRTEADGRPSSVPSSTTSL